MFEKMVLHFRNFQTVIKINEPFLKLQCNFLIHLFGVWKYDVNVICLDDKVVQRLNKRYRGVDAPTDVLSFSYHEVQPDIVMELHLLLSIIGYLSW